MIQDLSFIPSMERLKEDRFLYAVSKASNPKIIEGTELFTGSSPLDIIVDIEITVKGVDGSDYVVQFNDMVTQSFLKTLARYGYELNFISIPKYEKGTVLVWFKEVQQD